MEGQTGAAAVNQCPKTRPKPQSTPQMCKLQRRLTGTKSKVRLNTKCFSCLLDIGLRVTTIPQSFYCGHLSDQEIKPLADILEMKGANGQTVPYLEYVVDVIFSSRFLGASVNIHTFSFVAPDGKTSQTLVLTGTDTL